MRREQKKKSGGKKVLIFILIIAIAGVIYFVRRSPSVKEEPVVEKELSLYDEVTNYKTVMKYMSNSGFDVTNEIKEEDTFPIIVFENSDLNIKMEMQYCLTSDEDFEKDKEAAKELDDFKEYNINGYTGYGNTNDGIMFVYMKLLGNNQSYYIEKNVNLENTAENVVENSLVEENTVEENTSEFVSDKGAELKIFIERCNTDINTNVYEVFNSESVQNILNTMVFTK